MACNMYNLCSLGYKIFQIIRMPYLYLHNIYINVIQNMRYAYHVKNLCYNKNHFVKYWAIETINECD